MFEHSEDGTTYSVYTFGGLRCRHSEECGACQHCLFEGQCFEYNPEGPVDETDCAINGGVVCSEADYSMEESMEEDCGECRQCLFGGHCFEYDPEGPIDE